MVSMAMTGKPTLMKPLIELKQVGLTLDNINILSHIDLQLHSGEILTVVGPNGAGKTSLVQIVLGLTPPSHGQVVRTHKLIMGYMPQKISLNPQLPIRVFEFMRLVPKTSPFDSQEALARVGAQHLSARTIWELSGGEWQRILLARAIIRKPQLLILDEPTQGVDITGQAVFYQLLSQLRDELNCGVMMVSHDLHLVMHNTDRVICLNQHICCQGLPMAVRDNPAFAALFGDAAIDLAFYDHRHDHKHNLGGDVDCCDHADALKDNPCA